MTLLSHICSESGVIVLISAMLSSPICHPCHPSTTHSSPHACPQFVCVSHYSLSLMNSLPFPGVGVFWHWCLLAFIVIGIGQCCSSLSSSAPSSPPTSSGLQAGSWEVIWQVVPHLFLEHKCDHMVHVLPQDI